MVRMVRQLPELSTEPPRLYVVTNRAQIVLPDDRPKLEQAGLRGLLRVIGAENPQLRVSQIDLDDADAERDAELVAQELLTGSEEDETAWRGGQWYTARLRCTPLGAHERRTATVNHESDGMCVQVRNPGDLETLEFVAVDRRPPGPGRSRSRSRRHASSSPMSSARSAEAPSSMDGSRSWATTSPAW